MTGPGRNRILGVLFDLGGTLVDFRDFPGVEELAEQAGLALEADAISHWYVQMVEESDRLGGTWSLEEFWRRVIEGAGGKPLTSDVWTDFYQRLIGRVPPADLYSDVRMCLDVLQTNQLRLGVLTNHVSETSARAVLSRAGIIDYFAAIVASGTERMAKPDPRLFVLAAKRLGVPPSETLYVGDLPNTDVRAAERAGLHGLWLHRDGTGYGEDPPEITSLGEVPIWVAQFEVSGRGFARVDAEPDDGLGGVPQRPHRRP